MIPVFTCDEGRRMHERLDAIREALVPYPRVALSVESTPLHRLDRLSARIGRSIHVLREDLTGFALGGNKVRKLEYLVADALANGADTLITTGASSFSRNAAAAGKVFGLDVHVVVAEDGSAHGAASRALFERCDTSLHHVPAHDLDDAYRDVVERLRRQGRLVYELHPGGSDEIGALAYIRVFDRIVRHTVATGVRFRRIVLPTGSTGTQVGLLLGREISGHDTSVIGVAVSRPADVQRQRVRRLARSTPAMLGVDFDESALHVDDRFLGGGYAVPSEEGRSAGRLFATHEGILLDPVYTAKAAAALLHDAAGGALGPDEEVLFIHTGGNAGLYD